MLIARVGSRRYLYTIKGLMPNGLLDKHLVIQPVHEGTGGACGPGDQP